MQPLPQGVRPCPQDQPGEPTFGCEMLLRWPSASKTWRNKQCKNKTSVNSFLATALCSTTFYCTSTVLFSSIQLCALLYSTQLYSSTMQLLCTICNSSSFYCMPLFWPILFILLFSILPTIWYNSCFYAASQYPVLYSLTWSHSLHSASKSSAG